jgi:hypothetical protein
MARLGWVFWLVLGLAVVVRLVLLPIPNTDDDFHFQTWSRIVTLEGIHTIYDVYDPVSNPYNECQYPPGYLYVLWAAGKIYQHFFSPVFQQESILFLIILRIPTVLADLALGILIFIVLRRWSGARAANIAFGVYALSPLMILDSTIVTQIDSVQSLLMVGTILLLVSGKDTMAIACLAVALLTKLQAVILVPLVLFTVAQRGHWQSLVRGAAMSAGIFLLLALPFILHGRIYELFRTLLTPIGTLPFLSLNAFNPWWLIQGSNGFQPDSVVLLGFVTPRLIGLALMAAAASPRTWQSAPRLAIRTALRHGLHQPLRGLPAAASLPVGRSAPSSFEHLLLLATTCGHSTFGVKSGTETSYGCPIPDSVGGACGGVRVLCAFGVASTKWCSKVAYNIHQSMRTQGGQRKEYAD